MENLNLSLVIPIVIGIVVVVFVLVGARVFYKKAPPNVAMVVTGPSGTI